jgi:hypothetical protein
MQEVVNIAPLRGEPGLIAYQCPACGHVTSEILPVRQSEAGQSAPEGSGSPIPLGRHEKI